MRRWRGVMVPAAASRPRCQFGVNCYRANPVHRKDMSHPGDADWVDGDDSDDDGVNPSNIVGSKLRSRRKPVRARG